MILFIGDSLAVGTPLADYTHERVVKRAEVGIGTAAGVGRFLHPFKRAHVVVVSLGTNDSSAAVVAREARKVRRQMNGRCLLWVQVSGVPAASRINAALRRSGVKLVPWRSARVHPDAAGYRLRARTIARYVRQCT